MGSWLCRGSVFICLLLPENVIICDKCLSRCGKRAILNDLRFYYILRFITICVYRLNAKCNKKIMQNVVNFSTWYMLVVWSRTAEYDLECFL